MAQHADPDLLAPRPATRRSSGTEEPVEVRRYIDAIRRARWLIAAITVLLAGVVVGVSVSVPSRYQADASIVKEVSSGAFESVDPQVVTRELNTIGQLITTSNVLDAAARKLPGETGDSLAENVESSVDPQANLIYVTGHDGTAAGAARIANTVAQTFVDAQADTEKRQIEAARANLLEEQARLRNSAGSDSQLQAIQDRLSQLGVSLAAAGTDLGIAERAEAPQDRASPKPVRNGILALFLGLFI